MSSSKASNMPRRSMRIKALQEAANQVTTCTQEKKSKRKSKVLKEEPLMTTKRKREGQEKAPVTETKRKRRRNEVKTSAASELEQLKVETETPPQPRATEETSPIPVGDDLEDLELLSDQEELAIMEAQGGSLVITDEILKLVQRNPQRALQRAMLYCSLGHYFQAILYCSCLVPLVDGNVDEQFRHFPNLGQDTFKAYTLLSTCVLNGGFLRGFQKNTTALRYMYLALAALTKDSETTMTNWRTYVHTLTSAIARQHSLVEEMNKDVSRYNEGKRKRKRGVDSDSEVELFDIGDAFKIASIPWPYYEMDKYSDSEGTSKRKRRRLEGMREEFLVEKDDPKTNNNGLGKSKAIEESQDGSISSEEPEDSGFDGLTYGAQTDPLSFEYGFSDDE